MNHQIGRVSITRVTETAYTLPLSFLYPNWRTICCPELGRLLSPATLDVRQEEVILSVHTWVVRTGGHTLLIDTGIGNGKYRPFNARFDQLQTSFIDRLALAGVQPADVDYVLLTHLHADHVGWNTQFSDGRWMPTFPRAKYVFPRAEMEFFATRAGESRRMVFEDSVLPVVEANQATLIPETGGEFLDGIEFHPTPGHSIAHMAISVRSNGDEALFCGDVMHNPLQVYRPDWCSNFALDKARARSSRRWLLDYAAERGAQLFTAHFPESSVGRVTRNGDAFAWRYSA
ncbi:MBL fold metallo-hydrolase [Paraburkholderia rhizosphaerae]|uniref:MBL fold metallo-hydrolase n=1 Tax=Paraburkholderia rhizosphaerae TaxID=480658 RepID=UPI001FBAA1A9|nr:MBL fold metallo-hydrolase [Paraburkholderia rhizosphaerae]